MAESRPRRYPGRPVRHKWLRGCDLPTVYPYSTSDVRRVFLHKIQKLHTSFRRSSGENRLRRYPRGRPKARVLLEAVTESEWVARHLESLGHEVMVADPGYAPMYASRSRRVKTDKRDARALCDACLLQRQL